MAYIPEDKLLEIKAAASIEEVVGQYVKLERKGKDLWGICPFHADSKPSFKVSPDRGIFHCSSWRLPARRASSGPMSLRVRVMP